MTPSRSELISSTVSCFEELRLDELDENWVDDVITSDFSSVEDFSSVNDFVSDDLMDCVSDALDSCRLLTKFRQNDESVNSLDEPSSSMVWKALIENNIEMKNIHSLIFLLCYRANLPSATLSVKQCGLVGANLYLTMLQIPGSSVYSVYQPGLLRLVMSCIKFPKVGATKKKPAGSRDRNAGNKKHANRENTDAANEADDLGDEEREDTEVADIELSNRDWKSLFLSYADLLYCLVYSLSTVSLRNDDVTQINVIEKMVECITYEIHESEFDFSRDPEDILSCLKRHDITYVLAALAFKILSVLCQPLHGHVESIYEKVLKHLINPILCTMANKHAGGNITQKYIAVRTAAISFVRYNLQKHFETSINPTKILIQHLSVRVIDKTEFRSKAAFSIISLLQEFPIARYAAMIKWFERLAHSSRIAERMIALEVLALLLDEPRKEDTENLPPDLAPYITNVPLADCIIERCNDKAASVRTKAMSVVAQHLEKIIQAISGTSIKARAEKELESEVSSTSSLSTDMDLEPEGERREPVEVTVSPHMAKHRLDKLATLICNQTKDCRFNCRRSALHALEQLICTDKKFLTEIYLEHFRDAVCDPNVAMKKGCITSISVILSCYKNNKMVQSYWLRCVLPLVLDPEKTVQNKALEMMELQFLSNINGIGLERQCAWQLLREICCGEQYHLQRFFVKAFNLWKVEGKLRPSHRTVLEREVGTENNSAVWHMLSLLTANIEIKNTAFIVNYWENHFKDETLNSFTKENILHVIRNTCHHINHEKLKLIQNELENNIKNFTCPVDLIGVSIETLFKLYGIQSNRSDTYQRIISQFSAETMQVTYQYLSGLMLEKSPNFNQYSEEEICKHLYTLGDLAMLCPSAVHGRMFLIIQRIIARVPKDDDYVSTDGNFAPSLPEKVISPKVQAVAFITLGKFCLQNEDLTKRCIPVLAQELSISKHYVIRNNIVVVLTDLCMRYTSLVDLYIPSISACLKDDNALVRYQTLTLLSKLLQEEYVKWKDSLVFRMLSVVVDEDKKTRTLAEFCLGHMMMKRNPFFFSTYFIEAIFYFNAYTGTLTYNNFLQFDQDIKLFSLQGKENQAKRISIYKFMLTYMTVSKKFGLCLHMCQEILTKVAENIIPLDPISESIMGDCLVILSLDEFKFPTVPVTASEEVDEQEASAQTEVVKVTQRITLIQVIMPVVISLKKLLEDLKSPFLDDLMRYLRLICNDYKHELKEVFPEDPQFCQELEFDIRRYESTHKTTQQPSQKVANSSSNAKNTEPVTETADPLNKSYLQCCDVAKTKKGCTTSPDVLQTVRTRSMSDSEPAPDPGTQATEDNATGNDLVRASVSKDFQPSVQLEKLTPEMVKKYLPADAPPQNAANESAAEGIVEPTSQSVPDTAAKEASLPVVLVEKLDQKSIEHIQLMASSTPTSTARASQLNTIQPDVSSLCCSSSSDISSTSTKRRRRKKPRHR